MDLHLDAPDGQQCVDARVRAPDGEPAKLIRQRSGQLTLPLPHWSDQLRVRGARSNSWRCRPGAIFLLASGIV